MENPYDFTNTVGETDRHYWFGRSVAFGDVKVMPPIVTGNMLAGYEHGLEDLDDPDQINWL